MVEPCRKFHGDLFEIFSPATSCVTPVPMSTSFLLFVRENLGLSSGKDQRQFMREPLAIMKDFCPIFFLFFPMVGEFHGPPVGDVAIVSFAEYSIEHPRRAEQANMPAMQRREGPASNVPVFGKEQTARLTVGCGVR